MTASNLSSRRRRELDWINSPIRDPDLQMAITYARHVLVGRSDSDVKAIWNRISRLLTQWAHAIGLPETTPLSFPMSHNEWRYADCADIIVDLHKINVYPPLAGLISEITSPIAYAVLVLAESMAGHSGTDRLSHKISALKALPFLLLEQIPTFHEEVRHAVGMVVSQAATVAADARHAGNRRLKLKALELYEEHSRLGRSKRQVARIITPMLQEYGQRELQHTLRGGDPEDRVYRWILEARPTQ